MSDVHLFVESNPIMSVTEIVNRFKGRSSRLLRQKFPALRSRLPTLWSRSYYAASVGHVSAKTIETWRKLEIGPPCLVYAIDPGIIRCDVGVIDDWMASDARVLCVPPGGTLRLTDRTVEVKV
jgi:hypothetical protein